MGALGIEVKSEASLSHSKGTPILRLRSPGIFIWMWSQEILFLLRSGPGDEGNGRGAARGIRRDGGTPPRSAGGCITVWGKARCGERFCFFLAAVGFRPSFGDDHSGLAGHLDTIGWRAPTLMSDLIRAGFGRVRRNCGTQWFERPPGAGGEFDMVRSATFGRSQRPSELVEAPVACVAMFFTSTWRERTRHRSGSSTTPPIGWER